jgi:hypothetical protein
VSVDELKSGGLSIQGVCQRFVNHMIVRQAGSGGGEVSIMS